MYIEDVMLMWCLYCFQPALELGVCKLSYSIKKKNQFLWPFKIMLWLFAKEACLEYSSKVSFVLIFLVVFKLTFSIFIVLLSFLLTIFNVFVGAAERAKIKSQQM